MVIDLIGETRANSLRDVECVAPTDLTAFVIDSELDDTFDAAIAGVALKIRDNAIVTVAYGVAAASACPSPPLVLGPTMCTAALLANEDGTTGRALQPGDRFDHGQIGNPRRGGFVEFQRRPLL